MSAYDAGATGGTYAEGIEVMVRMALQSPNFIYRLELTPPSNPSQALVPLSSLKLLLGCRIFSGERGLMMLF